MPRTQTTNGRLAGKRVMFHGRFGTGEPGWLVARARSAGAAVADTLSPDVDLLVLPEFFAGSKAARNRVDALNARGAAIEIISAAMFREDTEPTSGELLSLIRGGKANAEAFRDAIGETAGQVAGTSDPPAHVFNGERFDGIDLGGFDFEGVVFERCSFVGAKLSRAEFDVARGCDFSRATGDYTNFKDVSGSKFTGARLRSPAFEGSFDRSDFSSARLDAATFNGLHLPAVRGNRRKKSPVQSPVFRKAILPKAEFYRMTLLQPDFDGTDLSGSQFEDIELRSARLKGASLKDGSLVGCILPGADLTSADLTGTNLSKADLTGATLNGADLTHANLRGAKIDAAALHMAKRDAANLGPTASVGPSLKALDQLARMAGRLSVFFMLTKPGGADYEMGIVGPHRFGYGIRVPYNLAMNPWGPGGRRTQSFADAMIRLGTTLGHWRVRFDTVRVAASKLAKSPKELRQLVLSGIEEAFGQSPPDAKALAAATKAHRAKEAKKAEAEKRRRAALRAAAKKREAAATTQAIERIANQVGEVSDFESFMKAIALRTDADKVLKAGKMLKASRFQLFKETADHHLLGVVKSQTDRDLVYACRIDHEGHYACCTQNLNICGGLRGSVCKHLLVLIIGLVKVGELDPATIDGWVAKTHGVKPSIDKEVMSEIFIRYKGAEAGEVDWRPTETVPEDYYAL
jgi:uncharacterized protein YjbI with pentapeptide repeats